MTEPIWIEEREAQVVHDRLLSLDGGASGMRDRGLLESALARPRPIYGYAENPNLIDLAVGYIDGIVQNHPFIDSNKRTGFIIGVLFSRSTDIVLPLERRMLCERF